MAGRAGNAYRRLDGLDVAPGGCAAPAPKPRRRELRISLRDPQLEHAIKFVKHDRRQGHLPDDAPLAALESLDAGNAALGVDRGRRQREHFRDSRAAPSER